MWCFSNWYVHSLLEILFKRFCFWRSGVGTKAPHSRWTSGQQGHVGSQLLHGLSPTTLQDVPLGWECSLVWGLFQCFSCLLGCSLWFGGVSSVFCASWGAVCGLGAVRGLGCSPLSGVCPLFSMLPGACTVQPGKNHWVWEERKTNCSDVTACVSAVIRGDHQNQSRVGLCG